MNDLLIIIFFIIIPAIVVSKGIIALKGRSGINKDNIKHDDAIVDVADIQKEIKYISDLLVNDPKRGLTRLGKLCTTSEASLYKDKSIKFYLNTLRYLLIAFHKEETSLIGTAIVTGIASDLLIESSQTLGSLDKASHYLALSKLLALAFLGEDYQDVRKTISDSPFRTQDIQLLILQLRTMAELILDTNKEYEFEKQLSIWKGAGQFKKIPHTMSLPYSYLAKRMSNPIREIGDIPGDLSEKPKHIKARVRVAALAQDISSALENADYPKVLELMEEDYEEVSSFNQ